MRKKSRIPKVLKEIERVWKKNSQLRLMQLLRCINNNEDAFYVEEDELLERIKKFDKEAKYYVK